MNFVPGRVENGTHGCAVRLGDVARLALPPVRCQHAGKAVTVGLRPEHFHGPYDHESVLRGTARVVEPLGADTLVVFDVAGCELQARLPPRTVRRAGDPVSVAIAPEHIHLFDPVTGRRL